MSEVSTGMDESIHRQELLERLQSEQAEIASHLVGWNISQDSDSLAEQRLRAQLFYELDERLVELLKQAALHLDGYELRLVTGEEPITSSTFQKGAYDMYSQTHNQIEPHSEVPLKYAKHWTIHPGDSELPKPAEFYRRKVLFVGDHRHEISLTTLAKTLHTGGVLKFVESPAEES